MRRHRRFRPSVGAAALVALALLAGACGGGGGGGDVASDGGNGQSSGTTAGDGGSGLADQCPLGAIDAASDKPVDITLWHSMTRANEETLVALTDQFNSSQTDVHVDLVNQTSYTDTFTKFKAGLSSGDLPDLVQIEDTGLQLMIDSQAVLPAQACVEADGYDLSDHLERVLAYYTVQDVLWPMPFNVSDPVLYFNQTAFQQAGLDPAAPPTTFDELEAAARAVVDSGAAQTGIAIKLEPWLLEQFLAYTNATYVDNDNGRSSRATEATFGGADGLEIFTWLDHMVDEGLAEITAAGGFDNLLAIGSKSAAMTLESAAALGTIVQVLESGQFADVKLGVGPFPGPGGDGSILVGGAALYMLNKSSPEKQEAAWRFATFLNEAQSQSTWAAGTGYVPVRQAATTLAPLTDVWAQRPEFKVAYDQLVEGPTTPATAGPVIGDYAGVRQAVTEGLQAMLTNGAAPADALQQAVDGADAVITDYNERIGA